MRTPHNRIAAGALVLVALAAAGVWWWQARHGLNTGGAVEKGEAGNEGNSVTLPTHGDGAMRTGQREDEAPAKALEACSSALRAYWKVRWEALGERGDTDSRITHALLAATLGNPGSRDGQPSAVIASLAEAARRAPRDPEAAWYYARHCTGAVNCDGATAVTNLLALEPDNLDGWLLALQLADREGDAAGVDAALEGGARARYFDDRAGESFTRMSQALKGAPLPPACSTAAFRAAWQEANQSDGTPGADDLANVQALAIALAELRAYSPLRDACGTKAVEPKGRRRNACLAILARLADGDQLIDRLIGETSMVELTAGTAQGTRWRERYRNTRWMMDNVSSLNPSIAEAARRWSEGEVASLQTELAARDRWPAPEGWLPEDERARSLILTGRPPPETRR